MTCATEINSLRENSHTLDVLRTLFNKVCDHRSAAWNCIGSCSWSRGGKPAKQRSCDFAIRISPFPRQTVTSENLYKDISSCCSRLPSSCFLGRFFARSFSASCFKSTNYRPACRLSCEKLLRAEKTPDRTPLETVEGLTKFKISD